MASSAHNLFVLALRLSWKPFKMSHLVFCGQQMEIYSDIGKTCASASAMKLRPRHQHPIKFKWNWSAKVRWTREWLTLVNRFLFLSATTEREQAFRVTWLPSKPVFGEEEESFCADWEQHLFPLSLRSIVSPDGVVGSIDLFNLRFKLSRYSGRPEEAQKKFNNFCFITLKWNFFHSNLMFAMNYWSWHCKRKLEGEKRGKKFNSQQRNRWKAGNGFSVLNSKWRRKTCWKVEARIRHEDLVTV